MYSLGKRSRKNMIGLHPFLGFTIEKAIKITEVDFGVIDGVRSMARQRELVAQGKSKTFNSYHLYGLAADLVPYIDGKYRWDDDDLFAGIENAMKSVIKEYDLPIEWGYDKWNWDKPHWQMTGYRDKYDIRKFS